MSTERPNEYLDHLNDTNFQEGFVLSSENNAYLIDGKIADYTDETDDYTTGCLLDYHHFKENYKLIAIDLSKQQALDADPKTRQQIIFTGNLALDPIASTIFYY